MYQDVEGRPKWGPFFVVRRRFLGVIHFSKGDFSQVRARTAPAPAAAAKSFNARLRQIGVTCKHLFG